jgi:hypothetical protein
VKSLKIHARLAIYLVSAPMFSVALAVAPTPSSVGRASNAAVVAQLMERERSSWTALQRHDKQAWESLLSDNYSHVNSNGTRMDGEGVINMFEDEVVESYSLHDMRGALLCPDVFLVAYWIERTSLQLSRKFNGAFASSSIWVKRSGNWLRLQYQETPMSPPPSNPKDATRSPVLNHDEWQ